MKKTKVLVRSLALYFSLCAIPVYAALPGNSILIGNSAYSSDYVAENTGEINTKMDSTKDPIYFIDENSNFYDMFGNGKSTPEKEIVKKCNMHVTYYMKNKMQSYIAKDENSPFELQNEYLPSENSVEAIVNVDTMGVYKTVTIKLNNLVGISDGKYFKLEDKSDIKQINGSDTISIFTSKKEEKFYIFASDKKTVLAEGVFDFSSIKTGTIQVELTPMQTEGLNPNTIEVTNNPNKSDIVEVSKVQPKSIIKVYYDESNPVIFKKATANSKGIATIRSLNLNPLGGKVYVTVTPPNSVESEKVAKSYGAELYPALRTKPSFTDVPGFENNGKTKIRLGSPSSKENSFRYKLSNYAFSITILNTTASTSEGWAPIANGDIISDASNKHVGIAEVTPDGKIVRFSEDMAVVVDENIAKLQNGVKCLDAQGVENNNKTEIILGNPSAAGNSFVYKVSSDKEAVPSPLYGDILEAKDGWKPVCSGDLITAKSGQHIGVAEIDKDNKAIQFSDVKAVVINNNTPPLLNGLKFVDAPKEENNGKTKIILGSPSIPTNTFKYKISESSLAVERPEYGTYISPEDGWNSIPSDNLITVENGKHIGVAEITSENEVIQFSDSIAVVIDENAAGDLSNLSLKYVLDSKNLKKILVDCKPSYPANMFKYIVSSEDTDIPAPNIGSKLSNWKTVPSDKLIEIEDAKYIGIAEVDSGSRVIKFKSVPVSLITIGADFEETAPLNGVTCSDVKGSENNGKTQISFTNAPTAGNSFKYFISSNDSKVPTPLKNENLSSWSDVHNGMLISTENGKNIGVAEVTAEGKAVKFFNVKAVIENEDRGLVGGVLFKAGTTWKENGKTRIVLGQPSVSGNKFKYTISLTSNPVQAPAIGTNISSWPYVSDGDLITVENGKNIGVAEVDVNNNVVAFSNATAVVENYAPPLVNGMILEDITGIENNGKVKVKLGTPSNVSNKYVYKIFSKLPTENFKLSAKADDFMEMPANNTFSINKDEYLGIAEIDNTKSIIQFSIEQMKFEDEKIETSIKDGQSKMLSGSLSVDSSDTFTVKVTKGTLKTGTLVQDTDFTVTGLPSGITISGVASGDNSITFTLSGSVAAALTNDVDIKVTLNYTCITESKVDEKVNSNPFTLTIKK